MKRLTLTSLAALQTLDVDTIIDVRAPAEFAQDHLPGALNMPVLSDQERAEVGTIYTQDSPFQARKTGGALVALNTARHLQGPLANKDGGWQPLVYCWRGGQRSGAFATILDQVGWRVQVLDGGYRSYRRQVVAAVYEAVLPHRLVLIDGGTGTAKTALLHHLAAAGAQVLDLEGFAGHRGSLFGALETPQPSQKMFESRIALALAKLDPDLPTFVEAESSKIGARVIPPSLWTLMGQADRVHISAPLEARSHFLGRAYADLTRDAGHLTALINHLRPYHAAVLIQDWHQMAHAGDWHGLAAELMRAHYDPRYAKSAALAAAPLHAYHLDDLEEGTLAATATDLMARFK